MRRALPKEEWEKLKQFFLTRGYVGFNAWVTPGATYEEYLGHVGRWEAKLNGSFSPSASTEPKPQP